MLGSYLSLSSLISEIWQVRTAALAFVFYAFYYILQVVKRPVLACSEGPFKQFLMGKIPTLMIKYWPTFWCVEGRIQTIVAVALRQQILPSINYRREIFTLSDGGVVGLDWLEDGCDINAPCIIFLPGITGASDAEYIKFLVLTANRAGFRVVVFQNRGLGGVAMKTPKFYCASKCEDLSEVVRHVKKLLPNVKIGATGISMGGLILGNYLARHREEASSLLTAAKIISVPWNVQKAAASVEKPIINFLLGRHLAKSLSRNLITNIGSNKDVFEGLEIDFNKIESVSSIREFDQEFTSKHFGYGHVNEYYDDATLHTKLCDINVPLLCLSAADDPFQPFEGIPIKMAKESTHVAIIVTARGGHIGFLEGCLPFSLEQFMGRIFMEYFTSVLVDHNGEFEILRKKMDNDFLESQEKLLEQKVEN